MKGYETRRAIFDGAREIDMVINVGALKSGDLRTVERDIEAVVSPCRDCGVLSKVIIEAAFLTDEEKVTACTLSKAAGADYVKTSTGFGPGGATAADVALMRRVVGAEMGVKAAGGVRDLEGLKAMVAAGATRVGASAGVKIVQQARGASRSAGRAIGILSVRHGVERYDAPYPTSVRRGSHGGRYRRRLRVAQGRGMDGAAGPAPAGDRRRPARQDGRCPRSHRGTTSPYRHRPRAPRSRRRSSRS